ncbi:hypothetical protein OKA05_05180 [Luteolibacter arcticus]|uniref:PEGA domain-containing protein n=1 Tax=Luteolibacter arcticus TaxID=1581411 RepID=A0ABT3GED5_9BACT|nr:hypothetical protein [Luteolibacter arcticus]MCW1921934.1 hypothetical protein [Luteolibacter arcticus]
MSDFSKIAIASATAASLLLSSCASIVSRPSRDVSIQSNPSGLSFAVINASGETIHTGTTPQVVNLSARGGYFKPAKYTVQVKRSGKVVGNHQVTAGLNGWYFGNILIGGLIGMLIVDPLTGAMYRMPAEILVDANAVASTSGHSLTIASIETLTPEQRASIVRL